ncbi:MAG: hypothetical protein MJ172_11240 [Clostridia bacterium]|nr:hypothetical protein [Clostridia bacterium]
MDNAIYELKMFSSCLKCAPNIVVDGMDMTVILKGYDDNDNYHECSIKFISVIGYQYTMLSFAHTMGAYDKIIQIEESQWKNEFKNTNSEKYNYWKPNHYVMFLDDNGLYQFLAQKVEVVEHEI